MSEVNYDQEKASRRVGFFAKRRALRRARRGLFIDSCSLYLLKRKHSQKRWRVLVRNYYYFFERRRWNIGISPNNKHELNLRRSLGSKKIIAASERAVFVRQKFFQYFGRYLLALRMVTRKAQAWVGTQRLTRWMMLRRNFEYRRNAFTDLSTYQRRLAALKLYGRGSYRG